MTNEQKHAIQWIIQEQMDNIYMRISDEIKIEPTERENEAFIDQCIHRWLKEGDADVIKAW